MAGAAAPAMPKHRQAGATNQACRSSATAGGLGPAARGVEGLGRSSGYGLRPSPDGSARNKAMKPHENLPDRLLKLVALLGNFLLVPVGNQLPRSFIVSLAIGAVLRLVAGVRFWQSDRRIKANVDQRPLEMGL